ncbi:hypothetical protein RGQ21_14840 [Kitasatospora aureofaciens]|nr:hypothetical protein RGQ21_14840 [Kitasatospora aureofaciens]
MTATGTLRAPNALPIRRSARVRVTWLLVLAAVLLVVMTASLALGSRDVAWSDVWAALGGADHTLEEAAVAKRIPRTLLAVVVGAALGLSGTVMQGVTRNPLADPGILGVKWAPPWPWSPPSPTSNSRRRPGTSGSRWAGPH